MLNVGIRMPNEQLTSFIYLFIFIGNKKEIYYLMGTANKLLTPFCPSSIIVSSV